MHPAFLAAYGRLFFVDIAAIISRVPLKEVLFLAALHTRHCRELAALPLSGIAACIANSGIAACTSYRLLLLKLVAYCSSWLLWFVCFARCACVALLCVRCFTCFTHCLLCFACRACFGQRQLGPTMHLHIITVIAMAMLLVMMITIVVMLLLMVIVFQFASLALLWRCSLCCVCFRPCFCT